MKATLENLLCIIHRDGGHYIAEHGLQKGFDDALEIHYRQRDAEEQSHNTDYTKCLDDIDAQVEWNGWERPRLMDILKKHLA